MAAAAASRKVLVLNAGSSSLKYKLFELLGDGAATSLKPIVSGNCERIGDPTASFMKVWWPWSLCGPAAGAPPLAAAGRHR